MSGGLPSSEGLTKKAGVGRDLREFLKWGSSAEWFGGDLLGDLFPAPEPIEFPEVKPATPPPTISETQEAGDAAKKRKLRGRGRRGTFLTGEEVPDLTPTKGKKKLLG